MPLSDHEQRLLDQIEQALYAEDPKFASTVSSQRLHARPRLRLAAAIAGIVAGLLLVVVGLLTKLIVLSVVGFVLIVSSCLLIVHTLRKPPPADLKVVGSDGKPRAAGKRAAPDGLRRRMEDRFRRRFDEN